MLTRNNQYPLLAIIGYDYFIIRLLIYSLFLPVIISCGTLRPDVSESDLNVYQTRLDLGWKYLNKRQHSSALEKFIEAEKLQPHQSEPIYGRAKALFYMDRFDEALKACSEFSGESAEHFNALGFCWGARLEISKAAPATQKEVQEEIERLLARPEPTLELLYSSYLGYYYLKDREKRLALILRLAEDGEESLLAESIASSLFEEIIVADSGSDTKVTLAATYLRSFPNALMADKAATLVLRDLAKKQNDKPDYWQIAQGVLAGRESPLLNSAVALWLINHSTDYDHAIGLLQKNLRDLDDRSQEAPPHFSQSLWQQELDKKHLFYKYLLGRAWLGLEELVKARRLFDDILAKQKDLAGVYHFRGMVALGEDQPDQAIEYFRTALTKGTARSETSKELRLLLEAHHGFIGEPLAYFQAQYEGARFSDVTEKVGLGGVKASRVAWGDYDNDGDDDLLLNGTRLFNNRSNGGFVEIDPVVLPSISAVNGGIWGDYDNDRFLDIFTTSHGENYLLHNEGGIRFSKTEILPMTNGWFESTEAAAWGDVNNDGYLDLYVANYEHGAVMRGQCGRDQLLVNQGGIVFKDSGVTGGVVSEEAMCGRGVTWSDLNDDGWLDIMVSNYRLDPNFLWLNQGNGSVVDVAESVGVQGSEVDGAYGHSIGSVSGDLDGDGDFDLFTSNLAHLRYIEFSDQSMVLLNNNDRFPEFTNLFAESGIVFDETSSDPLLFDVDNDGDLDLYITSIYRNSSSHLYINNGKGGFSDQTWLSGGRVMNGWGAASTDYDGDGYLDLLVASNDGVHLLRNEGGSHNWLAIKMDDQNCNRFGVGSKVVISYDHQSQVREITAGRGTGSQDSLTVHFGLGQYEGPVSVRVETLLCGDIIQRHIDELNSVVVIENKPERG